MNDNKIHDLLIVGAGPAALSAAIYTTREDVDTVLYEKALPGGLIATTDWVDNYPGFPEGIEGLALGENMRKQAERFGAVIEIGEVTGIKDGGDHRIVETYDGEVRAKTVLLATGSGYKKLGIPGEDEFYARGVHYCATCDGAFYRDKKLVVVGGGNSAVQEAMFLTRFASHIDLLVRSDFRASEVLVNELETKYKEKITVHKNVTTDSIVGGEKNEHGIEAVTKVIGTDKTTGKTKEFKTDGVFIFVGLKPNTAFLESTEVELDDIGLIKSDDNLMTSMKGVFVAGDCRSGATMQIATAVGEGATAALKIREFLEESSRK